MGKKILIIPDIHHHDAPLDIYTLYKDKVDNVVLLGDFFDDFEIPKFDIAPYQELYKQLLDLTDEKVAWVAGNHEMSYTWAREVSGNFDPRYPDYQEIRRMASKIYTLSTPAIKIDNCIFSHAGISNDWIKTFYGKRKDLDIDNPDELIQAMKDDFWFGKSKIQIFWNDDSPLWLRPDWNAKNQYKIFKNCWQFVGHTPVDDIIVDEENKVVFLDTFSATSLLHDLDYNLIPATFGSQTCIIIDSETCEILEKIKCLESN